MRDALSAVSENVSDGSGRTKRSRSATTLRTVADGADIVLLVLDAGSRQLVGEKVHNPDDADIRATILKQKLQTQEGRESAVRGSRMDTSHRLIAKRSILASRPTSLNTVWLDLLPLVFLSNTPGLKRRRPNLSHVPLVHPIQHGKPDSSILNQPYNTLNELGKN
ncbi:hypothetical protein EDB92DRAFT_1814491 [Lactarius akahatsu]|uniref:Uncharacterized protein n=1 Tax=Lactarius akahatsu TaxID=416441 RepID=A0AAD4LLF9_9AGAM|nr:hypothetical protein EDB92DRAFT_1814491 [Lactarius akahatsu]